MNNLFGFGSTLGDLAKDINGFVREVVDELQTVTTQEQENANDNNENDTEFDEEQAIEEELRHQLLQLSDDEDNGTSTIRDIDFEKALNELKENENENENETNDNENKVTNAENYTETKPANPTDSEPNALNESHEQKQTDTQKPEQKQQEYIELHEKYIKLKQHYRKSISLVEKYQIYNKSLKETLNEQMIIREQQQSQINEQENINNELNNKIINLQNEINKLNENENENKVSIFEDDMIVKSVSVTENTNEFMSKSEADKLRKTLQKASVNMKELKKRYKKVKDDFSNKIEEFDRLKSQYVTYKISNTKKLNELKNKLKNNMSNTGLNKELQTILNGKFIEYGICKTEIINPIHLEMISILNGCIDTMTWICNNSNIGKYISNIDDSKSDSVVIINDTNNNKDTDSIEMDVNGLENIKMNVVFLREVLCEFIGCIQQWLKVLNNAIDRKKYNQNGNDSGKQILTEEFQSID